MKIYQFNSVQTRQKAMSGVRADTNPEGALKKVSGGEDIVEISREAIELFYQDNVVAMERSRIKREVDRLMPLVRNILENQESNTESRSMKIEAIKEQLSSGSMNFNNEENIGETAEAIAVFLEG